METNVQTAIRKSANIQRKEAVQSQNSNDKLGKSDFLNLFMTQLSNQNPLDPMDSSKMVEQVSQLGNMEQLQLVNEKLDGVQKNQREILAYNSISYLNKDVSYTDNKIAVKNGQTQDFNFFVPEEVKKLKINVIDLTNGSVVAEDILKDVPVGERKFSWNGKNKKGEVVEDKDFRINFLATDAKGKRVEINSNRVSRVTKIKFDNGEPLLFIDGSYRNASEVSFIEAPPKFEGAEPLIAEMENFVPENLKIKGGDNSSKKTNLPEATELSEKSKLSSTAFSQQKENILQNLKQSVPPSTITEKAEVRL